MRMGAKVTAKEKNAYRALRRGGMGPEASAEIIGRSKSWAYNFEADEREAQAPTSPAQEPSTPTVTISDAVDLILCLDQDRAHDFIGIVERFHPWEVVEALAELSLFVSRLYVNQFILPELKAKLSPEDFARGQAEQEAAGYSDVTFFLKNIPALIERNWKDVPVDEIREPSVDAELISAFSPNTSIESTKDSSTEKEEARND